MKMHKREPHCPFSPWGEGAPKGRMRGPSLACKVVAPHQFGRMTYSRIYWPLSEGDASAPAAVSHGLTSSPPRGEGVEEPAP